MYATELRTEYLKNPMGIDSTKPRFFWKCSGGFMQTAYEVIVLSGETRLWESGKTGGSEMRCVYAGTPLKSRTRAWWKVRLWDENDLPGKWSDEQTFEIGLLNPEDWAAGWISGDYAPESGKRYPADCFRRRFEIDSEIESARLYASACGQYEAALNGRRVGSECHTPGITDYRKRVQYQTYDVTELIQEGINELTFVLTDGLYRGSAGVWGFKSVYGTQTKLLFQLEILMQNGERKVYVSDGQVEWSNDGPIRFADTQDGEIVDARRRPSYAGRSIVTGNDIMPTASDNVPVREHELFSPQEIRTPQGKKILDFGQILSGHIMFRVTGKAGGRIVLTFGEMLDENGEFDISTIQMRMPADEFTECETGLEKAFGLEPSFDGETFPTPKQRIVYIAEDGQNSYHSRFCTFGFRYVLVETDLEFDTEFCRAAAVYSDLEQTGTFVCSDVLINQMASNSLWSMKGNFSDIPTDCPTRERMGWTGDAQIFFNAASYFMNTAPFFRKWLQDMADEQDEAGRIPCVVPYAGGPEEMIYATGTSVGWADALIRIPYFYRKQYGDRKLLETFYGNMKRYMDYAISQADVIYDEAGREVGLVYRKGMHFGEWLEPEEVRDPEDTEEPMNAIYRPHPEEATAYLYSSAMLMAEAAIELNLAEDSIFYLSAAEKAKHAYQYLFEKNEGWDTVRQAKLVRPLAFGLLDGDLRDRTLTQLVKVLEEGEYRIGTGFLSTPLLLFVLSDAGLAETAYKVLENKKEPGWLSSVLQGATTQWEYWDGKFSRNHYSHGAVCEWLFRVVGGIEVDGVNHFRIAPVPGGTLTYAQTQYNSIYGKVTTEWRIIEGETVIRISVPSNTAATVLLPDGREEECLCGVYTFRCKKEGAAESKVPQEEE